MTHPLSHLTVASMPAYQQGQGEPVLLVHGALADARMWSMHQNGLAARWNTLAVTLRYFGTQAWPDDGPPFGLATHLEDLVRAIDAWGKGPVHLVAWSYSAHAALYMARHHSDRLRSVFVYEPGFPTFVHDPQALARFQADAQQMYAPVADALQRGDLDAATRSLMDASGQSPGYFDRQPAMRRALQMDNAHTLPRIMAQTPPLALSVEDLAAIDVPVCIAQGADTRPVFGEVASAAARAMPQAHHLVVPHATHMWPDEAPENFYSALESFWRSLSNTAEWQSPLEHD